jgi:hypothetical protein
VQHMANREAIPLTTDASKSRSIDNVKAQSSCMFAGTLLLCRLVSSKHIVVCGCFCWPEVVDWFMAVALLPHFRCCCALSCGASFGTSRFTFRASLEHQGLLVEQALDIQVLISTVRFRSKFGTPTCSSVAMPELHG